MSSSVAAVAKSVAAPASSFIGPQGLQIGLLLVCVSGIGFVIYMSTLMVGDTNNLNDVQKKMGIIVGVTFAIVLMLGIFTYLYIRSQPDMFVPIVLFMMFVNMEISLIAVGGSVLQKIV